KRPDKILDLMQTPKGYNLVNETLRSTPESRRLFQTFQRQFVEDIFNSVRDPSGRIDFTKAQNIFKNSDIRQVTEMIGGPNLVSRFDLLQNAATNFKNNISLFSNPKTQSLVKEATKGLKNAGLVGTVLHSLRVPWPIITGLGLAKVAKETSKVSYAALQRKVLSNPRAVSILESISQARTSEEVAKQIPRLLKEIDVNEN